MAFKTFCNCCGCNDVCIGGVDPFDTARSGYLTYTTSTAVFNVHDGYLNLDDQSHEGTYYKHLDVGLLTDLRVGVSCGVYNRNPDESTTLAGCFIGGVARIYNYCTRTGGVTSCRQYLELGCDAYGYSSGATPIDLGVQIESSRSSLTIGQDPFVANHYWLYVNHVGLVSFTYAYDITASIGSTINVGVIGSGLTSWENLCVVLNHKNRTRCYNCSSTDHSLGTPTRTWDLSVPAMSDGTCLCSQLSGDFQLKYHEYFNTACSTNVTCCWVTDEEVGVVCPPYTICTDDNRKWILLDGGNTLRGTSKWDVLKYTIVGAFDPIGPNTYNYSCTVCGGACVGYPTTLTITPHV